MKVLGRKMHINSGLDPREETLSSFLVLGEAGWVCWLQFCKRSQPVSLSFMRRLLPEGSRPYIYNIPGELARRLGPPRWLSDKEFTCNAGDPGSIPGLGETPGEGHGYPFQYSCLRIPWIEEPGGPQSMGSQRVRRD